MGSRVPEEVEVILKIEVHTRDDVYPTGGRDKLRRELQYAISHAINGAIEEVHAELKKVEFTRSKA